MRKRPTTRLGRARNARYTGFGSAVSSLVRRRRMTFNPTPTFVETYNFGTIATGPGIFQVRISDIPQIADYVNLYNQYRINWVKVTLLPRHNSYDPSSYLATGRGNQMPRIAWAINDTPALQPPANEQDVLTDNGAKVKPIVTMWTQSFKPRPDKFTGDAAGGAGVAVREKFNQWLSFAPLQGNNPFHNGISYYISSAVQGSDAPQFDVYYKVSFSLRDPK